jgi:hypothetical protein
MTEKITINNNSREGDNYPQFEQSVINSFNKVVDAYKYLFTTDAEGLYEAYLSNLPIEARQHYTCNACRHFIERYGGLVSINGDGILRAVMWEAEVPEFFIASVNAIRQIVLNSKVTGVFFSKNEVLGNPVTGEWTHLSAVLPKSMVYKGLVKGINEVTAEKKADYTILINGLVEYPLEAVEQAVTLLKSESLYRSEKTLGVAEWLKDLHNRRNEIKNGKNKTNITWLAVASAPPGYVHVKSSMIGTLLDDIVAGLPFESVSRRFAEKMNPLQYQRPQAAPTSGNIERAEKIVEKLGIQKSLVRRFARLDEIQTIWKPVEEVKSESGGVFSHLKAKDKNEIPKMELPTKTMTWVKFLETVLPTAKSIEFHVNSYDKALSCILTAVHDDAPPIIQWDSEEKRNPFSWYFAYPVPSCRDWNLVSGFRKVTGICLQPSMWNHDIGHMGKGVFFVIEGAKDTRKDDSRGNALLPEILKSELREIRSTIEAYSKSAKLEGYLEASACGVMFQEGAAWDAILRVTSDMGVATYKLDRWD